MSGISSQPAILDPGVAWGAHPPDAVPTELDSFTYDDAIVRKFMIATFIWGLVGMLVGLFIALAARRPALNFGAVADLRPAASAAHERGDLRVRRQRVLHRLLLLAAAAVQGADVLRLS